MSTSTSPYAKLRANFTTGLRFDVFTGTCYEDAADNLQEALRKARQVASYRKRRARIKLADLAPDGDLRITPPWPGGTWGGQCGSTQWLDDPGFLVPQDRRYLAADRHNTIRAWYANSRGGSQAWRGGPPEDYPGYRVGCERGHRHLGPCGLQRDGLVHMDWDGWAGIGYVPQVLPPEAS